MKTVSILAFIGLVGCVVGLLLTKSIVATGPVNIAIQVLAVALMVWARITFGARSFHATANTTSGGLVTSGPYKYLRHPIYAAVLYFVWAGVTCHLSILSVSLAIGATVATSLRMVSEEYFLVREYPEYAAYAETTRRVVPWVL